MLATLALISSAAAQGRGEVNEALSRRQHESALRLLSELVDRDPRNCTLFALQGIALVQANRQTEALAKHDRALQAAPDYLAALQGAAQIEPQSRDPGTQARLQRIVSVDSANLAAHAMLGVLAFKRQDCRAAARYFARARPALEGNRLALWQHGQCEGRAVAAARTFQRLLELDPSNPVVRFNLALSLFGASQNRDAIKALGPLIAIDKPQTEVPSLLADVSLSSQQVPEALETRQRAIAIHPSQERHNVDLANLCTEQ